MDKIIREPIMPDTIAVGITIKKPELEEMKEFSHVDANGPAVLAMARAGLEAAKARKEMAK